FLSHSGRKNTISTYNRLLEIGDELSLILSIPQAFYHHRIAVAGGFSAGKSEFISSFFKHNKVHLAIGINPTTAIPTYIMHNKHNQTELFAKKTSSGSGVINLTALDKDIHLKLSHEFLNEFGFNIKTIMPQMYFSTPLEFEHICFIDTPGYNPSNTGNGITQEDNQTALDFVNQSESIIWLIGVDSNGTILKS
ncbi:dynamin family protein, partial [Ursidibacter sp. B-7004-1]